MIRTTKDALATLLTGLVVLAFVAAHEGWAVPLVGDSRRWAAGAVLLLGMVACGLGSPDRGDRATRIAAALGIAALGLAAATIVTGSLTLLSLLVADVVALWALSTVRHALQGPPRAPLPV